MRKKDDMRTAVEGEKLLKTDIRGSRVSVWLNNGRVQNGIAIEYGKSDYYDGYIAIATGLGATVIPLSSVSYISFFYKNAEEFDL